jgi:hypothetical protein
MVFLEEQEALGRTLFRSTTPIAILRKRSRLSTLVSDAPATPPPPNFEPTRFWEVKGSIITVRRLCWLSNLKICRKKFELRYFT